MDEIICRYTAEYVTFYVAVILATWIVMGASTLVDLWTGIDKAMATGERVRSHGLRRTISKAGDYWRVQCFGLFIDIFGTLWFSVPYASILITFGILLIEGKSVIENLKAKKSEAANIIDAVRAIKEATTDKDAQTIIDFFKRNSTN